MTVQVPEYQCGYLIACLLPLFADGGEESLAGDGGIHAVICSARHVKLHVGKNQDMGGEFLLFHVLGNGSLKEQIKGSLNVRIGAFIVTINFVQTLSEIRAVCQTDQTGSA